MFLKPIPFYIQFYENRIKITRLDTREEVEQVAIEPFTTVRLLMGDFEKAENCLRLAIKKLKLNKWISPQFNAIVHPMSKTEGGLSLVENRGFKELAERSGGKKVLVYEKREALEIQEALRILKEVK